jgi:hypothetical protein
MKENANQAGDKSNDNKNKKIGALSPGSVEQQSFIIENPYMSIEEEFNAALAAIPDECFAFLMGLL